MDRVYSIPEIKNKIAPVAKKYNVKKVVLFGSYARNEATEASDIDFMIEKGGLVSYRDYVSFYDELLDVYGKEVDLITARSLLKEQGRLLDAVQGEGIVIYERT